MILFLFSYCIVILEVGITPITAKLFNLNFHHLKLCLADAIHNFKWVKKNQIWQNGGQLFSNFAGWCLIYLYHI